jgi:hypothetical protein
MPLWTSASVATQHLPEVTPKAIIPSRDVAKGVRRSGFSFWYRRRVASESTTPGLSEPARSDCGPRVPQIDIRFGNDHRWPWVIALVTIIAVSTLVAAIGVLAACVVLVQTVEMTDSLARQTTLSLAGAGTLVQVSLLAFMFVWEKYQHGERPAHLA